MNPGTSIRPSLRYRVHDLLISIGGYAVEPIRSVRRSIALVLDSDDFQAVADVAVYMTLATAIVIWASSMYLLVRAITGV